MTALYTCELQGYGTFDVMTPIVPRTTDVMRFNISPVRCVARIYEFPLDGLVRAGTPAASVAALSALASAVNTGTLPTSLKFKDSSGTVLPGIGDVREGTADLWEDLELLAFELPPGVEQLVAGVRFKLTFRARRSFPDADGVCEFTAERTKDADDLGRATRFKKCTIRLGKAAAVAAAEPGLVETSSAIRALLEEPKPVSGWIRTVGTTDLPFKVTYPFWPLTHVAETESEVTRVAGVSSSSGANSADVAERRIEEPELGIVRVINTAEVTGSAAPLGFVEASQPTDRAFAETFESLPTRHATGEWERIEPMVSAGGKTTKVTRRFESSGGARVANAVRMSSPVVPVVQTGAFDAFEIAETITVRAQAPSSFADFVLPDPLPATSWKPKGAPRREEPSVERHAKDAANRLWVFVVRRDYLWIGTGAPLDDPDLKAAVFSAAAEVL